MRVLYGERARKSAAGSGNYLLLSGLVAFLACIPTAVAIPQTGAGAGSTPVTIAPTVLNMTETGSGCPIGNGGMVHQIRNDTPVFAYMGWNLTLNGTAIPVNVPAINGTNGTNGPEAQDNHVVRGTAAKFCKEYLDLGNAPVGYQVRVAQITVSGYAELDPESFVGIRAHARFNGADAGRVTGQIKADQLKNNTFSVALTPEPVVWSPCVNQTGRLPTITLRTSVSVNGTALPSGTYSSGSLGSDKREMSKALSLHFVPEWRPCPAESLAPPVAPSASPTESAAPSPTSVQPSPSKPPVQDPPVKDPPVKDPPVKDPPVKPTDPPTMGGMGGMN